MSVLFKMKDNTAAVALLLVGALTSSFIAPISSLSTSIEPTTLLFYSSALAALCHIAFMNPFKAPSLWKNRKGIFFGFLGGAFLTWSYVIFAYSILQSTNAFLPTFAFELYPLGIIIFSNMLIRLEKISYLQMIWLSISLVGLAILGLDATHFSAASFEAGSLMSGISSIAAIDPSFITACISVIMLSFGMTCVSKAAKEFKPDARASSFASFIARIGGAVTIFPYVLFRGELLFSLGSRNLIMILFYGFIILTVSNVAYYRGITLAHSHLINVIWTVTPLFSVLWLYLLGAGQITSLIGIGAACIIVSNLMLNLYKDPRPSYTITILWILFSGAFIFYVNGLNVEHYFEAVSSPLIFFGLLFGFIVARLVRRSEIEQLAILEIVNSVTREKNLPSVVDKFLFLIKNISETNSISTSFKWYKEIIALDIKGLDYVRLDSLILSKSHSVSLGEIFVVVLISSLTATLSILGRANSFFSDSFALVISSSVVFTTMTIYDLCVIRRRSFLRVQTTTARGSVSEKYTRTISESILATGVGERVIVGIMLFGLTVIFISLFYIKHGALR